LEESPTTAAKPFLIAPTIPLRESVTNIPRDVCDWIMVPVGLTSDECEPGLR
jgi:hypothetical protein